MLLPATQLVAWNSLSASVEEGGISWSGQGAWTFRVKTWTQTHAPTHARAHARTHAHAHAYAHARACVRVYILAQHIPNIVGEQGVRLKPDQGWSANKCVNSNSRKPKVRPIRQTRRQLCTCNFFLSYWVHRLTFWAGPQILIPHHPHLCLHAVLLFLAKKHKKTKHQTCSKCNKAGQAAREGTTKESKLPKQSRTSTERVSKGGGAMWTHTHTTKRSSMKS